MSTPPTRVTRRSVLKYSAIGTLAVGAAGTALAMRKPSERKHPELKLLSPLEYTQFAALCEAVCPGKPGVFPSSAEIDLPAIIDQQLTTLDDDAVNGLKMALTVFDNALTGALTGGGLKPFSDRTLEERTATLTAWRYSDQAFQRTVFHAVTSVANSVYWGVPRVQQGAGYNGPPDPTEFRRTYAENLVDLNALRATTKPTEG